jgi:regulator of protease activity HflC (stomatin/prohibitin superfamily)
MELFLAALAVMFIGYILVAVKVIRTGNEAIVERMGRYHRKLTPGISFIVPLLDTIVLKKTTREQLLDIEFQRAITKDCIAVEVDAIVFWKILELEKAFYVVENVEVALEHLVRKTLRSAISELELDQTYFSRLVINRNILEQIDKVSATWGVKITRVEVHEVKPPIDILESLAKARAAENEKMADIYRAEGQKQAMLLKIETAVEAIKLLSDAIDSYPNAREVLQFLKQARF